MKPSPSIYIFISFALISFFSQPSLSAAKEEVDEAAIYQEDSDAIPSHFEVCRAANKSHEASIQPPLLNYRGPSLISKSTDETDLVICLGDTFGDLNGTYVTLEDCSLTMYHQGKMIWSSPIDEHSQRSEFLCALSLQKDGMLMLWKEGWQCFGDHSELIMHLLWSSSMDFKPKQTELKVQDQQLQLVQTFQDGSQRIFYTGENIREFREDLGAPKQVAEKFLLRNHNDTKDSVILKRNEYIGDLNDMHLILQTNCELQLNNNSHTIWSFAAYIKPDERCTLRIQGNSIGIPGLPGEGYSYDYRYNYKGMNILPPSGLTILQSNITFSEGHLLIIQTLKNGCEVIFYNEPGQDNGLKSKRKLTQIAKDRIIISDNKNDSYIIRRLDYIGDLDGLHLILRDNCAFTLANGQQELWRLTRHLEPDYKSIKNLDGPYMECNVQFNRDGTIIFNRFKNNHELYPNVQVFGERPYDIDDPPSRFELFLENNTMIMAFDYQNKAPEIYHANANTNGTWLRFISASSVIINANDANDEILPSMGYIGDIHGVFTMLDRRGNWMLFNKTHAIWESGSTQSVETSHFHLVSIKNGAVAMNWIWQEEWSTKNQTVSLISQAEVNRTELLVRNDGMWLINTFVDGTVEKYKALEGTNHFIRIPNEYESTDM